MGLYCYKVAQFAKWSLQKTRTQSSNYTTDGSMVWLAADSDQNCMEWKWYLVDGCLYVYSDQDLESSTTGKNTIIFSLWILEISTIDVEHIPGEIFLHGYKAQSGNIGGKRHAFEMIPTDHNLNHFYFHAQTEPEKKRLSSLSPIFFIKEFFFSRWLTALEYSIDRWMRLS